MCCHTLHLLSSHCHYKRRENQLIRQKSTTNLCARDKRHLTISNVYRETETKSMTNTWIIDSFSIEIPQTQRTFVSVKGWSSISPLIFTLLLSEMPWLFVAKSEADTCIFLSNKKSLLKKTTAKRIELQWLSESNNAKNKTNRQTYICHLQVVQPVPSPEYSSLAI